MARAEILKAPSRVVWDGGQSHTDTFRVALPSHSSCRHLLHFTHFFMHFSLRATSSVLLLPSFLIVPVLRAGIKPVNKPDGVLW